MIWTCKVCRAVLCWLTALTVPIFSRVAKAFRNRQFNVPSGYFVSFLPCLPDAGRTIQKVEAGVS